MTFASMKLNKKLMQAIEALGYKEPTNIQKDAMPPALKGRDILAAAETGSGKTAAFLLPILHHMLKKHEPGDGIKVLILSPTRELAAQLADHFRQLSQFTEFTVATIYGGVSHGPQEEYFRTPVDVLVATPGRLLDHLQHDYATFNQVRFLVLDEADRMLDMGFLPDVERVLERLPEERQNFLFSATIPKPIAGLAQDLLDDPVGINLEQRAEPPKAVRQVAFPVREELKRDLLLALLRRTEINQLLIFTRSKHRANRLAQFLQKSNVPCDRLHGNRSQAQRAKAMAGFRDGSVRVLVATNLVSRGIDVEDLSHVLNFDVPHIPEDYIHRVGRTARAGVAGDALTLFSPEEVPYMQAIERAIGWEFPKVMLEEFDYDSTPGDHLEVPVDERLANLRKRRADERSQKDKHRRRRRRGGGRDGVRTGAPREGGPREHREHREHRGDHGGGHRRRGRRGGGDPDSIGNRAPAPQRQRGFGGRGRDHASDDGDERQPAHVDASVTTLVHGASDSQGQNAGGRRGGGGGGGGAAGRRRRGRGGAGYPQSVVVEFRDGEQPVLKPEFDLPRRDERQPKRKSHQPAALSQGGRRFQAEDE